MIPKRALLSVSDKAGLPELAAALATAGCELVSTGGTRRVLEEAGLPVTDIQSVSGNPEAFGGRMKTISFAVESALLFDRERDAEEAASLDITAIDLVVCNLYPFVQTWSSGVRGGDLVEQIDIGGPTMVRAAAKNHRWVAVVVDPGDYDLLTEVLRTGEGISAELRRDLARKAFHHTADYDAAIATALDEEDGIHSLRLAYEGGAALRYGENWHQEARIYRQRGASHSLADMEVLGGKALSYNNLVDIQAAMECVRDLGGSSTAIIKHTNPCGLASGTDQAAVLAAAWDGDPVSAFGSVIAFDQPVDEPTLRFLDLHQDKIRDRKFVEAVIAPDFTPAAVDYLKRNENLRIIRFDPRAVQEQHTLQPVLGALLVQDADSHLWDQLEWVTSAAPEFADEALCAFGYKAVRQVKSNAIVVVRRRTDGILQLLGMGAGQPNRIDASRLAVGHARDNLARELDSEEGIRAELGRCLLVSDAFFPFPDNVQLAAESGIFAVIQPGGSIRDKRVIAVAHRLGVAMAFTGVRHFRH